MSAWVSCAEVVRAGGVVTVCSNLLPKQTRDVQPMLGLMLAHRLRRSPNINPALVQRLMFAGMSKTNTQLSLMSLLMGKLRELNKKITKVIPSK